jgi:hypothetical protein
MSESKQGLAECKRYWQYFTQCRDRQLELQAQIQNQFKQWRAALRKIEMRVLDDLK